MSRMTVTIDDELLEECREYLGVKTKREAIIIALEDVRRRKVMEDTIALAGKVDLDLTQEKLKELRRRG